jgi:transcriptional regulator with XRE-family HTH domain
VSSALSNFSTLVEQIQQREAPVTSKSETRQFGEIIRAARHQRGLTQRQLADRLAVSNVAVAHWERGTVRPTLENRIDLARALDIPLDDLLDQMPGKPCMLVTDPLLIRIVRRLEELTPEQRQALLTVVLVAASDETD